VVSIIVALAAILDVGQPDFTLRRAFEELYPGADVTSFLPPGSLALLVVVVVLLVQAVVLTPVLWGEEFGWRSYLQIRLLADRPPLATVVTGLIWGVWHYPLILAGYERYESPLLGMLVFTVSTVLISIIFGWLRLRTRSIWCSSLAHSSTNSVGGSLTVLLFLGGADYTLVSYLGVLAFVPLRALCAWIIFSRQLKPYAALES
jgi:membrane protease YdiL (CAAX protease family)